MKLILSDSFCSYGWQNIGEYLTLKSRRSPRLNVLRIMNRNNHLEAYVSSQSINSDVIITCIDAFFFTVDKPTVIVVDQLSIHTSDSILIKLKNGKNVVLPSLNYLFTPVEFRFCGGLLSIND